jgi:hypothetical protein
MVGSNSQKGAARASTEGEQQIENFSKSNNLLKLFRRVPGIEPEGHNVPETVNLKIRSPI